LCELGGTPSRAARKVFILFFILVLLACAGIGNSLGIAFVAAVEVTCVLLPCKVWSSLAKRLVGGPPQSPPPVGGQRILSCSSTLVSGWSVGSPICVFCFVVSVWSLESRLVIALSEPGRQIQANRYS
jgi:hypothetical protein